MKSKFTFSNKALLACCTLSMCSSLSFLTISAVWRASSASKLASKAATSCLCFFSNTPTSPPSLITYKQELCDKFKIGCVTFHKHSHE